jgi:MSHA biogenesis protein MshN
MSVINKMLRDLDARQAAATGFSRDSGTRVMQGTTGVPGQQSGWSQARALRWLLALLVLLLVIGTAWYFNQVEIYAIDRSQKPAVEASMPIMTATTHVQVDGAPSSPALAAPESGAAATPLPVPPKIPVQTTPAVPSQPLTTAPRSEPVKTPALAPSQRLTNPVAGSRAVSGQGSAALISASPQSTVPKPADRVALAPKPAAAPAAEPAATRTTITPAPQPQRQSAAQETLAHAQALWAGGSREAALELVRDAVAVAEQAQRAGTLAAGSSALPSLVREQVRMELTEGRVSRVLDLLVRLEPLIADQADLWAVRGNAAQRLARHQESVHAYLKALELRSDEPRWMLGAAVSLAALGQLQAAAEQAEKARAAGIVSPEILAYLRQAGVPLK